MELSEHQCQMSMIADPDEDEVQAHWHMWIPLEAVLVCLILISCLCKRPDSCIFLMFLGHVY
jgi:hypothetical protein